MSRRVKKRGRAPRRLFASLLEHDRPRREEQLRRRKKHGTDLHLPGAFRLPTFKNAVAGVEQHERLIELIRHADQPRRTRELLDEAGIAHEEGLGALRMLNALDVCHCISGGRSQLLWRAGPRPAHTPAPKLADREDYLGLRNVLRRFSAVPMSTDAVIREAGFRERERKAVRGALKALVALGLVRWSNYNRQAVAWQWATPGGRGETYIPRPRRVSFDESLHQNQEAGAGDELIFGDRA